jgi:hypothetical protein
VEKHLGIIHRRQGSKVNRKVPDRDRKLKAKPPTTEEANR